MSANTQSSILKESRRKIKENHYLPILRRRRWNRKEALKPVKEKSKGSLMKKKNIVIDKLLRKR
jgi:hypothetical protein